MAEAKMFTFTYQELAELMVRKLGLSEGLWGVYMKFGIGAANAGPGPEDVKPTAIVPVLELGLQRFEEPSSLTVDAAQLAQGKKVRSRAKAAASQ